MHVSFARAQVRRVASSLCCCCCCCCACALIFLPLFFFSICVVIAVSSKSPSAFVGWRSPRSFSYRVVCVYVVCVVGFFSSRGFKTLIIVRDVFFRCLSMDDTNRFCRPNEATTARPWCSRAAARPTKKASVREDKSRLWD